jgi:hypothetical protein
MINCVLAIISWGYFNIQRSWMDYLDPLDYENTLNVIYHIQQATGSYAML